MGFLLNPFLLAPAAFLQQWNILFADFDAETYNAAAQISSAVGVSFKDDGTKMYVLNQSNQTIYQYSLSTAWDVSTASYDSVSFSVATQDTSPNDIFFKPDGTRMYMVGTGTDSVYQYALSTPWDLSTTSYSLLSFTAAGEPTGIAFKDDGTKLYIIDATNDDVRQYSVTVAWSLSVVTYDSVSLSISNLETDGKAIFFRDDGSSLYVAGSRKKVIFEYSLSTDWDLSTATYAYRSLDIFARNTAPQSMYFRDDGEKIFLCGTGNNLIAALDIEDANNIQFAWGSNGSGRLGLGDTTNRSSPTQIGSSHDWEQLYISKQGSSTAAIDKTGRLYTWGGNGTGSLGLGDTSARSSPVQVGSETNWLKVAVGSTFMVAIKRDGTIWSWGENTSGQLGLSDLTNRSSPVQIGSSTNWLDISAGSNHATVLNALGQIFTWGLNTNGQLGLGDTTTRSSPVQIGAATDWAKVFNGSNHTFAMKNTNSLFAWGTNTNGNLGLGDVANRSSPVQVGALTNWLRIGVGAAYTLAVKTDGTAWSWGSNGSGQLGHGNTTARSSPVQIGALTTWVNIDGASGHSMGINTSGGLYSWGLNSTGELGQNDTTNRSSPVQIGANSWVALTCGSASSGAIRDG